MKKPTANRRLRTSNFVVIRLALALQTLRDMLWPLKAKPKMSPLMVLLLLSLVPFPILAVAFLTNRWMKPAPKAVS